MEGQLVYSQVTKEIVVDEKYQFLKQIHKQEVIHFENKPSIYLSILSCQNDVSHQDKTTTFIIIITITIFSAWQAGLCV